MQREIEAKIPKYTINNHEFTNASANYIYVVDWTNFKCGEFKVKIHESNKPEHPISGEEVNSVIINNKSEIKITFDLFGDNALPIKKGLSSRQCECVCFPSDYNDASWILFIETKYAEDIISAFDEKYNYPYNMKEQIKATVQYFRDKSILEKDRIVNAVISFPNVNEPYHEIAILQDELDEFYDNCGIIIRATNTVEVVDETDINLIS